MALLENIGVAALIMTALALTWVAFRAWRHDRRPKVLLMTVAFALFFAKAILLAVVLFTSPDWAQRTVLASLFLDVAALGLLYAAVLAPR